MNTAKAGRRAKLADTEHINKSHDQLQITNLNVINKPFSFDSKDALSTKKPINTLNAASKEPSKSDNIDLNEIPEIQEISEIHESLESLIQTKSNTKPIFDKEEPIDFVNHTNLLLLIIIHRNRKVLICRFCLRVFYNRNRYYRMKMNFGIGILFLIKWLLRLDKLL